MEDKIGIYLIVFFTAFLLFFAGIILFFMQYKSKQLLALQEKQLLERLHREQLLSTQLDTQQQTMEHIGAEIHDSVAQKLTLASLYSKQLTVADVADTAEKLNAIGGIIDESLAELRQLSQTLTNPLLANADLMYLLTTDADRINASGACTITIRNKAAAPVLPQEKKNILYRLLQEFIQNSLKHAACSTISIDLDATASNMLEVTAADNGKGFDTSRIAGSGIGLQSMKSRAGQLKANYSLKSKPGCGTVLTLAIQIK